MIRQTTFRPGTYFDGRDAGRAGGGMAILVWALAAACGTAPTSATGVTAPTPTPLPLNTAARLVLRTPNTLGQPSGYCFHGIPIETRVFNDSASPLSLKRVALTFTPASGACSMTQSVSAVASSVVAPGSEGLLGVQDVAPLLCSQMALGASCAWEVEAEIQTERERVLGHLRLVTTNDGLAGGPPVIHQPADGALLSGVAVVLASVAEGCGRVNTARTFVGAFSEGGDLIASAGPFEFDPWRWNTRNVPNGRYVLRAWPNSCPVLGPPVSVTVRN